MARAKPKSSLRGEGTAGPWLAKIDAALAREKTWRDQGRKVVQRYRDEREKTTSANSSKINILWANKEVLQSALFPRMPRPDVRRRFPDAKTGNSASRVAAEVIERATSFVIDTEDVEAVFSSAIEDMLLPGRGTVWASYEPEIEEPEEDDVAGVDGDDGDDTLRGVSSAPDMAGGVGANKVVAGERHAYASSGETAADAGGRIVSQRLCLEYVYWEDYCQGLARVDKHVPWKARRHTPSEEEFEAWFPDAGEVGASYKLRDTSDQGGSQEGGEFVEVWEIWAKGGRKRLYVARGYADILEPVEDPYGLSTFYPTPRPLRSVSTTDTMIPRAEFLQYQDQANELDIVATRIKRLTQEIKFRGIYDATIPDGSAPGGSTLADMSKADDGEFLPHSQYQAIRDRGGIEAAFGFMPIEMLVKVVAQLSLRRAQLIEEIYQITGISDIVRGSTDPNETKGAQTLKAQFGGMRMNNRNREVQRFIRDAYRLIAEIVAEHFTQDTLAEITGIDLPTKQEQMALKQKVAMLQQPPGVGHNGGPPMGPEIAGPAPGQQSSQQPAPGGPPPPAEAPAAPDIPPELLARLNGPNWDDVMEILRSDKLRGYRVDIETDSTMQDEDADKQRRIEAITAINDLLEKAYVAAMQAPKLLPLIKELTLFGLRTFKPARSLEQAVEDVFDELTKSPPPSPQQGEQQQQGPDPAVMARAQAAVAEVQRKAARDKAEIGIESQRLQAEGMVAAHDAKRQDALAAADIEHSHADIRAKQVGSVLKGLETQNRIRTAELRSNPSSPFNRKPAA